MKYPVSQILPRDLRRLILIFSKKANVGHIGSALSIVEIISSLYSSLLRIPTPLHPQRDRFILSKGHAALALYAALHLKGFLKESDLDTFCAEKTKLGVHPERGVPGIDFTTGSLGQGLSMGAGAALAGKLEGSARRVYILISDAECNEGVVWEVAMFAAHKKLSNLIVIVDKNGQQALGYTRDVLDLGSLENKWQAFGWNVKIVDGHDVEQITKTAESCLEETGKPSVIIANTIFGKGVSYMENQIKWHYVSMSAEEFALAMSENP